jgi:hypothetical protein
MTFVELDEVKEAPPGQALFAVSMRDYSVSFIDFYWADSAEHAMNQAINANPTSRHDAVALVPYMERRTE